jgi:hypothetical protein
VPVRTSMNIEVYRGIPTDRFGRLTADRVCINAHRSGWVLLARFAFQACSFNQSDISPIWNQRVAGSLEQCSANLPSHTFDLTCPVVPIICCARARRSEAKLCQTLQRRPITYVDLLSV